MEVTRRIGALEKSVHSKLINKNPDDFGLEVKEDLRKKPLLALLGVLGMYSGIGIGIEGGVLHSLAKNLNNLYKDSIGLEPFSGEQLLINGKYLLLAMPEAIAFGAIGGLLALPFVKPYTNCLKRLDEGLP